MLINVFWSGGLDSTCRIFQLSKDANVTIQPYYITDDRRLQSKFETDAIKSLTTIIRSQSDYRNNLLEPIIVNRKDILISNSLTNAYTTVNKRYIRIGTQYVYMSALCEMKNIECEFSMEKVDNPRFRPILFKYYDYTFNDYHYKMDKKKDLNNDYVDCLQIVFHNILLAGTIFDMTKMDEYLFLKEKCPEILSYIVFCDFNKPQEKPCGKCASCQEYIDAGVLPLL